LTSLTFETVRIFSTNLCTRSVSHESYRCSDKYLGRTHQFIDDMMTSRSVSHESYRCSDKYLGRTHQFIDDIIFHIGLLFFLCELRVKLNLINSTEMENAL